MHVAVRVRREHACERLPASDIVPGEVSPEGDDLFTALEQRDIDGHRFDIIEERGHVPFGDPDHRARDFGRVNAKLLEKAARGPGEETAVPERPLGSQRLRFRTRWLLDETRDAMQGSANRLTGND